MINVLFSGLLFIMSAVLLVRLYTTKEGWWNGWRGRWRGPGWRSPYWYGNPQAIDNKAVKDCLEIHKDDPEKCKNLINSLKQ